MRPRDRRRRVQDVSRPVLALCSSFHLILLMTCLVIRTASPAQKISFNPAFNQSQVLSHANHSPVFRPVVSPKPSPPSFLPILKFPNSTTSSWRSLPLSSTAVPIVSSDSHLSFLNPSNSKILPTLVPKDQKPKTPVTNISLTSDPMRGSEQRITPSFSSFEPHSDEGRTFLYSYQTSHPKIPRYSTSAPESDLSSRIRSLEQAILGHKISRGDDMGLGINFESSEPFPGASMSNPVSTMRMGSSYGTNRRQMHVPPMEVTHELPANLPSYILDHHKDHMQKGITMEAADPMPHMGMECRTEDECHDEPPTVVYKLKKVKKKKEPKVRTKIVYKIKKIYVPKPYAVIKKIKVVKKVPKVVYKDKIKIKTVIKKIPVVKKVKIPYPVKVKYIKEKKIKIPVYKIKKVKVPVIQKVVQFVPRGNVKHVHVHMFGNSTKKAKKSMGKKLKDMMKKKKKKGCPIPLPMPIPMPVPGVPPIPPIPPIPGVPPIPMIPGLPPPFGRRRRSAPDVAFPVFAPNYRSPTPSSTDTSAATITTRTKDQTISKRFGWFSARRRSQDMDCSDLMSRFSSYFGRFVPGLGSYSDPSAGSYESDGEEEDNSFMRKKRRRKRRAIDRYLTLGPRMQGFLFHDDGWSAYGQTMTAFMH